MDSKNLDVCNSLERDKACWRCCCQDGSQDGRKAACDDGLESLRLTDKVIVGLRELLAPTPNWDSDIP